MSTVTNRITIDRPDCHRNASDRKRPAGFSGFGAAGTDDRMGTI